MTRPPRPLLAVLLMGGLTVSGVTSSLRSQSVLDVEVPQRVIDSAVDEFAFYGRVEKVTDTRALDPLGTKSGKAAFVVFVAGTFTVEPLPAGGVERRSAEYSVGEAVLDSEGNLMKIGLRKDPSFGIGSSRSRARSAIVRPKELP